METYLRFSSRCGSGRGGKDQHLVKLNNRLATLQSLEESIDTISCIRGQEAQKRAEAYLTSLEQLEKDVRSAVKDAESEPGEPKIKVDIPMGLPQFLQVTLTGIVRIILQS